jgi:hypothetical protein
MHAKWVEPQGSALFLFVLLALCTTKGSANKISESWQLRWNRMPIAPLSLQARH